MVSSTVNVTLRNTELGVSLTGLQDVFFHLVLEEKVWRFLRCVLEVILNTFLFLCDRGKLQRFL